MDGYLKENLKLLKESVVYNDFDGFIVIAGKEGYGKSTFAFQIAKALDPSFCLDRVVFSLEQFQNAIYTAEKFQCIVFDETMGYLSSRSSMSRFNKALVKIFSEMRSRNLFVILNITSFFELDRYPAVHRSNSLLYVHKRGQFASFDYNTKRLMYFEGKRTYTYCKSPNFYGHFLKYFPLDKQAYEKKKQDSIKEWDTMKEKEQRWMLQRDSLIKVCMDRKLLTAPEIADVMGVSPDYVYKTLQFIHKRNPTPTIENSDLSTTNPEKMADGVVSTGKLRTTMINNTTNVMKM